MSGTFRVTSPARSDFVQVSMIIAEDSVDAAERFLDAAESAFATLARFPHLGRAWTRPSRLLRNIRVWPIPDFDQYLIFYRPIPGGVEILHVFHGVRDLDLLLDEPPRQ